MARKENPKHSPHRLGGNRAKDDGNGCARGGKSDGARGKPPAGNRRGDLMCDNNNQKWHPKGGGR